MILFLNVFYTYACLLVLGKRKEEKMMIANIIFTICIFTAISETILFIANGWNGSLVKGFNWYNRLLLTMSLTGIVTHIIGIW